MRHYFDYAMMLRHEYFMMILRYRRARSAPATDKYFATRAFAAKAPWPWQIYGGKFMMNEQ